MNKLFDIIATIEKKEFVPTKYYTFTLIPPVVLILQLIDMTMASIGNIFGVLQAANIQFDPYYFLDKYIPYINWDDFRQKSELYRRKIDVKTGVEQLGAAVSQGNLGQAQFPELD